MLALLLQNMAEENGVKVELIAGEILTVTFIFPRLSSSSLFTIIYLWRYQIRRSCRFAMIMMKNDEGAGKFDFIFKQCLV